MDFQKMMYLALAFIAVVAIIGGVIVITGTGSNIFKDKEEEVNSALKDARRTEWDGYQNQTVLGDEVIKVIDKAWTNDTVDVTVSTRDGEWIRYSSRVVDSVNPTQITGMPKEGAVLLDGTVRALSGVPKYCGAVSGLTDSKGYNHQCKQTVAGYIDSMTTFVGSVQRDKNDVVRRVTFVAIED